MWAEAAANGPAQLRVATVSLEGKASAVFEWLEASLPCPALSPFILPRGGTERHRLEAELRVRASLYSGAPPIVRSTLCALGPLFLPHLSHLDSILQPRPAGQELARMLQELHVLARGAGESQRPVESFGDIHAIDAAVGLLALAPVVTAEAAARLAASPPRAFGASERVAFALAEWQAGKTSVSTAPRAPPAPAGEDGELVLDQAQTGRLCAALRAPAQRVFLARLEALALGVGAAGGVVTTPDPHSILAHLMTSSLKVVRRFAMGKVRGSLTEPSIFPLGAV